MLEVIACVYGVGAALVALMFVVCAEYLWRNFKDEPMIGSLRKDSLLNWWLSIAPEYILFWPWRCVGFPAYVTIQIKRGKMEDIQF